ncbi:MAG TPA: NAD(P)H-binding protein [Actinomycetota bacterium]|nr:NAD(P)H-binding protein [Actinomycetota bacterium]
MTVMVTGASGVVGDAVVRALVERDEVRATVRRPETAEALRAIGAKVAVRPIERADDLAEILPRVHTIVHLIGGPNQLDDDAVLAANHDSAVAAVAAASEAGVRRFVLVSVPGADVASDDPFLRGKGLAEEVVASSGLEHAIVRLAPVYGVGGLWFTAVVQGALADPPLVAGDPERLVAPVFADDVGALVAVLDDHTSALAGTWALEGPEMVPLRELVHVLRDDERSPTAIDDPADAARRLTALLEVPISTVAAAWIGSAGRADGDPDAAEAFGVARTGLLEGLRATLARAGEG